MRKLGGAKSRVAAIVYKLGGEVVSDSVRSFFASGRAIDRALDSRAD